MFGGLESGRLVAVRKQRNDCFGLLEGRGFIGGGDLFWEGGRKGDARFGW